MRKVLAFSILAFFLLTAYGCSYVIPVPGAGVEVFGWGRDEWLKQQKEDRKRVAEFIRREKEEWKKFLAENTPLAEQGVRELIVRLGENTKSTTTNSSESTRYIISKSGTTNRIQGVYSSPGFSLWVLRYPWETSRDEYAFERLWDDPKNYPQIFLQFRPVSSNHFSLDFHYDKYGTLRVMSVMYKAERLLVIPYSAETWWLLYYEHSVSPWTPMTQHSFSEEELEAIKRIGEYLLSEVVKNIGIS